MLTLTYSPQMLSDASAPAENFPSGSGVHFWMARAPIPTQTDPGSELFDPALVGYPKKNQGPRVAVLCFLRSSIMTLTRSVSKNAFRNKRRSILTVLSIAFLCCC